MRVSPRYLFYLRLKRVANRSICPSKRNARIYSEKQRRDRSYICGRNVHTASPSFSLLSSSLTGREMNFRAIKRQTANYQRTGIIVIYPRHRKSTLSRVHLYFSSRETPLQIRHKFTIPITPSLPGNEFFNNSFNFDKLIVIVVYNYSAILASVDITDLWNVGKSKLLAQSLAVNKANNNHSGTFRSREFMYIKIATKTCVINSFTREISRSRPIGYIIYYYLVSSMYYHLSIYYHLLHSIQRDDNFSSFTFVYV